MHVIICDGNKTATIKMLNNEELSFPINDFDVNPDTLNNQGCIINLEIKADTFEFVKRYGY